MVVAGGRLFWIADAYTTTGRIPYSEPLGDVNYIRNSVKVVIDAYNGTMRLYDFAPQDPLLRTYARMFPGIFLPASQMPATLHQHVRYPEDYFAAQAELFATYHVTNPSLLYNKGNQWQIPTNLSISGAAPQSAYYMIMRLPGQTREEFVLILPYVPNGRANMIAWLGAQSDAPNYGKAVSFEFPSSLNVYGPAQVEAAINQDPLISSPADAVGPAGVPRHLRQPAHRADPGLAAVRAAAVPAVVDDGAAADPAGDRVLPVAVGDAGPADGAAAERGDGAHAG